MRQKKPAVGSVWRQRGGRLVEVIAVGNPRGRDVPAYVQVRHVRIRQGTPRTPATFAAAGRKVMVRLDRFHRLYRERAWRP